MALLLVIAHCILCAWHVANTQYFPREGKRTCSRRLYYMRWALDSEHRVPGLVLGSGWTTDQVTLGTQTSQEAEDGVNDKLAWEVTLTLDLERGSLRPETVMEPGGPESVGWAMWLQRRDGCTQAMFQESPLSWGGRNDKHSCAGLLTQKITYIKTQGEKLASQEGTYGKFRKWDSLQGEGWFLPCHQHPPSARHWGRHTVGFSHPVHIVTWSRGITAVKKAESGMMIQIVLAPQLVNGRPRIWSTVVLCILEPSKKYHDT